MILHIVIGWLTIGSIVCLCDFKSFEREIDKLDKLDDCGQPHTETDIQLVAFLTIITMIVLWPILLLEILKRSH